MYQVHGALGNGFYESFSVASDEAVRLWWIDQWSTPAQQEYNSTRVTCQACNGWGYAVSRRGRTIERDRNGCWQCQGLGSLVPDNMPRASLQSSGG